LESRLPLKFVRDKEIVYTLQSEIFQEEKILIMHNSNQNTTPVILLEDLIAFDKIRLAETRIIFGRYKKKWILVLSFPFLLLGLSLFMALYTPYLQLKLVSFLTMVLSLLWASRYGKKKTLFVLKKLVLENHLTINLSELWAMRNTTIRTIQLLRLNGYLSERNKNTASTIRYIIDALRAEGQYPRYQYQFLHVFLTLISVIIAAVFAAITAVPKMFSSFEAVIFFFKPVAGISLLFVLFFLFSEFMLIKGMFELQNQKHKRLIRLLENSFINIAI